MAGRHHGGPRRFGRRNERRNDAPPPPRRAAPVVAGRRGARRTWPTDELGGRRPPRGRSSRSWAWWSCSSLACGAPGLPHGGRTRRRHPFGDSARHPPDPASGERRLRRPRARGLVAGRGGEPSDRCRRDPGRSQPSCRHARPVGAVRIPAAALRDLRRRAGVVPLDPDRPPTAATAATVVPAWSSRAVRRFEMRWARVQSAEVVATGAKRCMLVPAPTAGQRYAPLLRVAADRGHPPCSNALRSPRLPSPRRPKSRWAIRSVPGMR